MCRRCWLLGEIGEWFFECERFLLVDDGWGGRIGRDGRVVAQIQGINIVKRTMRR